ncbi:MAG: hypothetical protein R6X08_05840 [Desulfosalsimonadaceae bacterium]
MSRHLRTSEKMMNLSRYPELAPKSKIFKKSYAFVMLLIVGRGIEAAAAVDPSVKKLLADLPAGFVFCLGISPAGPWMLAEKNKEGRVRYLGWRRQGRKIHLCLAIKNIESAIRVFTFQESTARAYSYDRFMVEGNLPQALKIVRVLDIVEVYLLPKPIARLAVKRYPKWSELSPVTKHINRIRIYLKALSPGMLKVIYKNI